MKDEGDRQKTSKRKRIQEEEEDGEEGGES